VYIISGKVLYSNVKNVQSGPEYILFWACGRPECNPSTTVTLRSANTCWRLILNN